jgi:hypothetical protein
MKFMKRNLTVLLASGALVGALSAGLTFAHAQTTNPVTPATGASTLPPGAIKRHPAIVKAIQALLAARTDIENTNHDFGGHKKEALDACTKAIKQLELALESLKTEKK